MSYFDLGIFGRAISTDSPDAQTWFDRGLTWVYAFNHEEAITCFEKALSIDPDCAMAQWGIAYSVGPNYNKEWDFFEADERRDLLTCTTSALSAAQTLSVNLSAVENDLINALTTRYPDDPEIDEFAPFNDAYATAMRTVYAARTDDLDVTALFAEALMNRTPWALWDLPSGQAATGADTLEAKTVLEQAFDNDPAAWEHPGLLHMYIHLMEMSPTPEAALRHGDRLRELVPDGGHLVHMATHIDVLCGEYQNVVARNSEAAAVDAKFFDHAGGENFYTVYRLHNLHFIAYGAMFLGQPKPALQACKALQDALPGSVVRYLPDLFEAFVGMDRHVMMRFGMWSEILDLSLPEDPELYSFTTALTHYARAVALANLGRPTDAVAARDTFLSARDTVQDTRYMFNNPCSEVLKTAEAMLLGGVNAIQKCHLLCKAEVSPMAFTGARLGSPETSYIGGVISLAGSYSEQSRDRILSTNVQSPLPGSASHLMLAVSEDGTPSPFWRTANSSSVEPF